MRELRSTLILLVILIGLGAYIYSTRNNEETVSEENRVFASLEADDLQSITVRAESGDTTTLERSGDSWQIVSPITAPASSTEASGLASTLTTLDRTRVVDEAPANLAEFGLAPPRVSVEFKTSGDAPAGGLLIGNKTTTGQSLYAKRSDGNAVFLIPSYQESSLNKSTFDLREKAVLAFNRDQVQTIQVTRDGESLTLQKNNDQWRLTAPVDARADLGMVEGLIGSVAGAQMRTIVSENPTAEELRRWGLADSAQSITLTHDANTSRMILGGQVDDNAVYAKDAAKSSVVTIDKTVADAVARPAVDYRRRDVFGFRAYTVKRIELARSDSTVTFERVDGSDSTPDSWRRVGPNPADIDRAQMETLLTGLADMRVTTFVTSTSGTGLDAPVLTVTATYDDDNKTETVQFGRQGTNAYAARGDEPGAMQIDATNLDEALEALNGLAQ
jgi:hypothetical protein